MSSRKLRHEKRQNHIYDINESDDDFLEDTESTSAIPINDDEREELPDDSDDDDYNDRGLSQELRL